jgi:hypothetical protein
LSLLRAAVDDDASRGFEGMDAHTVRWAIRSGLGPLLRRLTPDASPLTASPAWPAVVGAELAARIRSESQLHALEDVLDACAGRVPPPTLLKGISLCSEHYAAPCLRPMGDIDVLVDVEWIADVERLVRELGYRPVGSSAVYRHHHHITPLVHPDTEVWIELHHALFPPRTAFAADAVFSAPSLRAERRPSLFRGRPVHHLSPELQLVYLPVHWAQDPKLLVYAGGLRSMLDTMLILRSASSQRWPTVLAWLDGAAAATQVYLMLAYLEARQLVTLEPGIVDGIRRRQRSFGPGGLRLAFELLDRYVVDGRPRGRVMGDRVLALTWRALLQRGGSWRKAALVSSTLFGKAARVSSELFRVPR